MVLRVSVSGCPRLREVPTRLTLACSADLLCRPASPAAVAPTGPFAPVPCGIPAGFVVAFVPHMYLLLAYEFAQRVIPKDIGDYWRTKVIKEGTFNKGTSRVMNHAEVPLPPLHPSRQVHASSRALLLSHALYLDLLTHRLSLPLSSSYPLPSRAFSLSLPSSSPLAGHRGA